MSPRSTKNPFKPLIHFIDPPPDMTYSAGLEATPRASIDTIVCENPPDSKDDDHDGATVPPNNIPSTSPVTGDSRSVHLSQDQLVRWEHIRTRPGLVDAEEGGIHWDSFRNQIRLAEDDKNLLKQIGQTFLVLLTSPFMLLYGAFKMLGTLFNNIGVLFTASAVLCKKLTWKPKKRNTNDDQRGMSSFEKARCVRDELIPESLVTGSIQI